MYVKYKTLQFSLHTTYLDYHDRQEKDECYENKPLVVNVPFADWQSFLPVHKFLIVWEFSLLNWNKQTKIQLKY